MTEVSELHYADNDTSINCHKESKRAKLLMGICESRKEKRTWIVLHCPVRSHMFERMLLAGFTWWIMTGR